MKICYLCSDLGISIAGHKGASTYVRSLVKEWTDLGHEVVFMTPSSNSQTNIGVPIIPILSSETFDSLLTEQRKRVEENSVRGEWAKLRLIRALGHIWNNIAIENVLQETVSTFQPDFIYERYSPFGVAGGVVAKKLGIPYALQFNAPLAWEGTKYRKQALPEAAEALEQIACAQAPLIIVTCQELKDMLAGTGIPASKVKIVPCGADSNLFSPDGPDFRPELKGKFVIGFVGSLKPWHGLENLAEAFKELVQDPRYHLMVVGDGPMMKDLSMLSEEVPGRMTLVGAVPHKEVPKYLRAIDVSVVPYPALERFYFSPLKILESMAAGRAVVASQIGQISEIIRNGETGILVPPGDVTALVKAIRKLAANDELRGILGKNATAEIRAKHTWRHRAEMILDFAQQAGVLATESSFSR
jgi:glycosyltransferase involved in cell wall biosynthesis